jgi:uncharacterized membrane protein
MRNLPSGLNAVIAQGRVLFGIAIVVYGVENLFCGHLGLTVRGVPWFSTNAAVAYITAFVLILAGLSLISRIQAYATAVFLGVLFLFYTFIEVPVVFAKPMSVGARTMLFEALIMCASAFTLAATVRTTHADANSPANKILNRLIQSGPYLFGISAIVFGIDHFLILDFIASLVPPWLPGHLFWAYLTAAAFVLAGLAILVKWMDQWGAFMLGVMFLLWFLILHSPRVVKAFLTHNPNLQNEVSSAFIALAVCGGSWICAQHAQQRHSPD